jgi:hypothetical protein
MQDTLGVASHVSYFGTARVLPQTELVLTESMRTQDLLILLIPNEGTDLTLSVHCVDELSSLDVPEPHCLV